MTRSFVSVTPQRIVLASCALLAALFAIGWMTRGDPGERPSFQILDGGFLHNDRISQMDCDFLAAAAKPPASAAIIEASFEHRAGSMDIEVDGQIAVDVADRRGEPVLWSGDLSSVGQVSDLIVGAEPRGNSVNPRKGCTTLWCIGLCVRYPRLCKW